MDNLLIKRSPDYDQINEALNIVKNFLIEKQRILYGGMAIDFALKLAGHIGIYDEDEVPDYDFMSPTPIEDSMELTDILHEKGFKNAGSINALHPTTRRVRFDFNTVADITYIPSKLYDKLPTLLYENIRIIHPHYQRMDPHRVFTLPYENEFLETITHRAKKDFERFKLLDQYYPIKDIKYSVKTIERIIKKELLHESVITGIVAFCLMEEALAKSSDYKKAFNSKFEIVNDEIKVNVPQELNLVSVESDYIFNFQKRVPATYKYYNEFMDVLHRRCIGNNWEILDNKGSMISCFNLGSVCKHFKISDVDLSNIYVITGQGLLLYWLANYWLQEKKIYLWLYCRTIDMIIKAEKLFPIDSRYALWFVTHHTYGKYNWSKSYINKYRNFYSKMLLRPSEVNLPPFGYYPSSNKIKFDYEQSEYFQLDGELTEPFHNYHILPRSFFKFDN